MFHSYLRLKSVFASALSGVKGALPAVIATLLITAVAASAINFADQSTGSAKSQLSEYGAEGAESHPQENRNGNFTRAPASSRSAAATSGGATVAEYPSNSVDPRNSDSRSLADSESASQSSDSSLNPAAASGSQFANALPRTSILQPATANQPISEAPGTVVSLAPLLTEDKEDAATASEAAAASSGTSSASSATTTSSTTTVYTTYSDDGAGTSASPYKIHNSTQFVSLASTPAAWSKTFVLESDIDLSSVAGNHPIIGDGGILDPAVVNFTGTFDGNGYKIIGFYHHNAATNGVAPFGNAAAATIKNLTVENVDIVGSMYVGGIVGLASGSVVSNCVTSGSITGSQRTGGLVGHLSNGLVINSSSSATVTGGDRTGGLVGRNYGSRISSSFATGNVTGTTLTGGLTAEVSGDGDLNNSYATGNVTGTDRTGGLVGYCDLCFRVTNNYSTGNVTGTNRVGGLIGHNTGAVSNSFTTGNVGGTNGSGNTGQIVGFGNGLTNVYHYASATCDSDLNSVGFQVCNNTRTGTKAALADFYDTAQAPLSSWDFTASDLDGTNHFWVSGTSFPTLWHQAGGAGTAPWSGQGTPASPFLIQNEADFNLISFNPRWLGSSFELTANLDFSSTTFVQAANSRSGFYGSFDGNSRSISNITLNTPTDIFTAVFGVVVGDGIVKNLSAVNLAITGGQGTAGLVGLLGGDLENVSTSGTIIGGNANHMLGGIAGWMKTGSVSKSHSTAALQPGGSGGTGTVGGLVGNQENYALVETSYFSGTITGTRSTVGGLVGNTVGTIRDSYVTADVVGRADVGGLVGKTLAGTIIQRCYTLGNVTSVSSGFRTGGLVGSNTGSITNSFAIGNISGHTGGSSTTVGMLFGNIPGGGSQSGNYYYASATCDADSATGGVQACNTTSAGSKAALSDFHLSTNSPMSTWDFTSVWQTNPGSYPTLR